MSIRRLKFSLIAMYLAVPALALADANSDLVTKQACQANPGAIGCNGVAIFGANGFLTTLVSALIFVVGAVSLIMIIIGGLRYALSGGDSAGIRSAKDTILYAIVGLIVSILAYAIVQFVIGRIK